MNVYLAISLLLIYFVVLIAISYLTTRKINSESFYNANRKSPWYLIAWGMIGTSISGVTFISVPGDVGNIHFNYFQMIIGYLLGYFVIATILLPLYYRLNLTSIYQYLKTRFGISSYRTGSILFIVSRSIGSSVRLFLVAMVLQLAVFDPLNIPFAINVIITIALIYVYTYKGGVKTVIYTDSFQTFFMIGAVIATIYVISDRILPAGTSIISAIRAHEFSTVFEWDINSPTNFYKQFLAGAFIAIAMTGLDQDMMQKNLTCKSLKDAQKNMFWFSLALVPVNLLFMSLGVMLYMYADYIGIEFFRNEAGSLLFEMNGQQMKSDQLYPYLAFNELGTFAAVYFLIGVIAAAYSSADSALTSLTTSFSIDILGIDPKEESKKNRRNRTIVHIGFSTLSFLIILVFKALNEQSVITAVFKIAGYTYGPLLGLFAFGLFTKLRPYDRLVPILAIASPLITWILSYNSEWLFGGYRFGFELLLVNGLIMFLGLWFISGFSGDKKSVLQSDTAQN